MKSLKFKFTIKKINKPETNLVDFQHCTSRDFFFYLCRKRISFPRPLLVENEYRRILCVGTAHTLSTDGPSLQKQNRHNIRMAPSFVCQC